MKRALIACLLATTAGCSGGTATSPGPTADTTPPNIVLSPSSPTIQGGETVAITVTATDAVDGTVTSALSCTGGTLVGNLLVTSPVTSDTSIDCTATATDKAGNTGSGKVTIQVKTTVSSVTLPSGYASLLPGDYATLFVSNVPLEQPTYQGTLDGKPITLVRSGNNTLAYQAPVDATAGDHRLTVTLGTRTFSFAIAIGAAPTIADPKTYVLNSLSDARDNLDSYLAAYGAGMATAQRAQFQTYRDKLSEGIAQIGTYSAADLKAAAIILYAGRARASTLTTSAVSLALDKNSCLAASVRFLNNTAITIGLVVGGGSAAVLTGGTGIGFIAGIGVFAGGVLFMKRVLLPSIDTLVDRCLVEKRWNIFTQNGSSISVPLGAYGPASRYVRPLAVTSRLSFQNDKPLTVQLQRTMTIFEEVAGGFQANLAQLASKLDLFGLDPKTFDDEIDLAANGRTETLDASPVTMGGISRSDVTGSSSGSAGGLTLRYKAVEATTANIDFSFILNRPDAPALPVEAQLTTGIPEADDAAVDVPQGVAITSAVQSRGATTLEIVSAPAHGSAVLQNNGSFTYTPAGQYFGPDQFTYRARNAFGVSKTATVLLSVKRDFTGSWLVTAKSTTATETSKGLCPNETRTQTFIVSKVSDILYTTRYLDFQLDLTMSSASDPNGLSGTLSGTYDDDPGETTESLTVSIPDSTHLTGSTTWSYAGPNNSRCTGSTQITGRRP